MDPRHLVQVFTHTGGGRGKIATGYPVAPGRVLTAKHALQVDGATGEIEVRWYNLEGPAREWRPATVKWKGADGVDAAILACEFPAEFAAAPYAVAAAAPWERFPWKSAGFAAAGAKGDEIPPTPLTGSVFPVVEDLHRVGTFHLSVDSPPGQAEDWQGASGSPVFVDQRIVGVVASAQRLFQGSRLSAVSTLRLLDDPEFRAAIGYSEKWRHLEDYTRKLTAALAPFDEAIKCLAAELQVHESAGASNDRRAADIVEQLLRRRLEDVLPALHNAQRKLLRSHEEAARAILAVAQLALPVIGKVAEAEVADWLDSTHGLISLPVVTETLAEISLAAADGRALLFRPGTNPPEPLLKIPPVPSGGETAGAAGFEQLWDDWVIRKVLPEVYTRKAQGEAARMQMAAEELNERLALDNQRHYYVIDLLEPQEVAEWNDMIGRLRRRYPAVVFVLLRRDDDALVRERRAASLIRRIFDQQVGGM